MKNIKRFLTILFTISSLALVSCSKGANVVINDENAYNNINETFTIIFENNDGSIISNQILKYDDEVIIPSNFEKKASPRYTYTFIGWDLNGDNKADEIPKTAKSSFVAKAIYEYELNEYQVTFNPNCGSYSGELNQMVGFGASAKAPTNLVKEGYDFVSWDNSFDYITQSTTLNAIWIKHKFTIHLIGTDSMNVNYDNDYEIDAFFGYADSLPIPTKTNKEIVFAGWKDSSGRKITNEFGDVLEPLCYYNDIYLEADYKSVISDKIFTLSRVHRNEITDDNLVNELIDYTKLYQITSNYFYYNSSLYYQSNDTFEHGYLIDYILLGMDDTIYYLDGSSTYYLFLSVDVIDYTLVSEYETVLNKFESEGDHLIGIGDNASLPYARKKKEMPFFSDDDEDKLDTLMYDKVNGCYRTDLNEDMHLLTDEEYPVSSLTYLVSNTTDKKNIPYQYTNIEGIVGTIESDVEYGVRYLISSSLVKW